MHSKRSSSRRTALSAVIAAVAFSTAMPASSQVLAPELATAESMAHAQWALGAGIAYENRPYRDVDDKVKVLPLVLYENRWVSLYGTKFDLKLPDAGPVSLRLRAHYANDGYEADDSPYLAGMAERKGGIWLGAAAIWRSGVANVALEALTATGDAEGKRAKLEVNRDFHSGPFSITPRLAAGWYDSKYVDYYYGVRADEVRAGRPQYGGGASTNVEAGVRFGYTINHRHHVFVDIGANHLGSAVKDSPLVERASERTVRIGYMMGF